MDKPELGYVDRSEVGVQGIGTKVEIYERSRSVGVAVRIRGLQLPDNWTPYC